RVLKPADTLDHDLLDDIECNLVHFLEAVNHVAGTSGDEVALARQIRRKLEVVLQLPVLLERNVRFAVEEDQAIVASLRKLLSDDVGIWSSLLGWVFLHALGKITMPKNFAAQSRTWIDEWRVDRILVDVFRKLNVEESATRQGIAVIKLLTTHQRW